jgi:hypothetical protein
MANWTLTTSIARVKFFLRVLNTQFYKDDAGTEQPITDYINEGIADMTCQKQARPLRRTHALHQASRTAPVGNGHEPRGVAQA